MNGGRLQWSSRSPRARTPAARTNGDLLTDPQRFHLELVVTSHDNRRIFFSENTDIHESLIVARRPTPENRGRAGGVCVPFGKPRQHLRSAAGWQGRSRTALDGDLVALSAWGTVAWRTEEQVRGRPWNAACFYDQSLARRLRRPVGQRRADAGLRARRSRAGRTARPRRLPQGQATPEPRHEGIVASQGRTPDNHAHRAGRVPCRDASARRTGYDQRLWNMRGHLLLANRMRLNLTATPAIWSDEAILGSAFVPVTPHEGNDSRELGRAWCAWLNSSAGVLAFLDIRQKNLTYPHFSLDGLRNASGSPPGQMRYRRSRRRLRPAGGQAPTRPAGNGPGRRPARARRDGGGLRFPAWKRRSLQTCGASSRSNPPSTTAKAHSG